MQKKSAITLLILCTLFWGGNFNASKLVVEQLHPLVAAALRFSLAAVFILGLVFLREKKIFYFFRRYFWTYLFLGIVGIAGANELLYLGLKYTTPVNTSFIMATTPLVTLMIGSFLLKESIHFPQKMGIALSFFGISIVLLQGSLNGFLQLKAVFGDLIVLGANVCWSLYGVVTRSQLKDVPPLVSTACAMGVGACVMVILAASNISWHTFQNMSGTVFAAFVYMAIFGTVLAYFFWNIGITHLGAGKTAVFYNLVPVFTILISVSLGNKLTVAQILGGGIVILGVFVSSQSTIDFRQKIFRFFKK